ncbi:MAG: VCBS repeat-containing protein, partial [Candidatus Thiodiazotropha taylori]|nr:VCBS repeat-containing protein [Candidatus Thiodiazotropha taylori]
GSSARQEDTEHQPVSLSDSLVSLRHLALSVVLVLLIGCNSGSSNSGEDNGSGDEDPIEEDPVEDDPEPIEVAGISLGEVSGLVKAVMALDADMDGDLDILATTTNRAFIYENVSLTPTPEFAGPVRCAVFTQNSNYRIMVDMNSDGDLDAIATVAGNYSRNPQVVYEANLGSNDYPEFKTSDLLAKNKCSGNWIVSDMSHDDVYTAVADIDADGDLDLFIGQKGGDMVTADIGYCENTGTAGSPSFAKATRPNPFGLVASSHGSNFVTFGDMDNDGDLDAWVNHDSISISYEGDYDIYENSGTAQSASFRRIASDMQGSHGFPIQGCQHPAFADFDGDGNLEGICADGMDVKYFNNSQ